MPCRMIVYSFVARRAFYQGDEAAPPGVTAQTCTSLFGLMTRRYAVIRSSVIWTVSTE